MYYFNNQIKSCSQRARFWSKKPIFHIFAEINWAGLQPRFLKLNGMTQKKIAEKFNVGQMTISRIKREITWDWVD